MIDTILFRDGLRNRGAGFFTGVPDSLLKEFCACVTDTAPAGEHVPAANEGNAVALAVGYHLASGGIGVVYMQNSGLGNAVNPLTSLTDPEVYRIPVLLIVGWRGEPGVKDEPQHVKQGRISAGLLDLLEIPYRILDAGSDLDNVLDELFAIMTGDGTPAALLVRKNTFGEYKATAPESTSAGLMRETVLAQLLDLVSSQDLVVSTTGKTSRELFELRISRGETPRDFLTVGSMGHTSSIALGIALAKPGRRVICLDGDGSMLMHLGSLAAIGTQSPANLVHVLLNNGVHESVGGQPTAAPCLDLAALAGVCRYKHCFRVATAQELSDAWAFVNTSPGPILLEIAIRAGSRAGLGRPTTTPEMNKRVFMK